MTSSTSFGPFDIEFDYAPADPGVRYLPGGGGEPPQAAEVEVTEVGWNLDDANAIREFLAEFLELDDETELPTDTAKHVKNFQRSDGQVPRSMFDPWFKEHEASVWEQIDDEMEADDRRNQEFYEDQERER